MIFSVNKSIKGEFVAKQSTKYGRTGIGVCLPPYNFEPKHTSTGWVCTDKTGSRGAPEVVRMRIVVCEMETGEKTDLQIFRGWQVTGIRSPKHPGGCARRWSPGSCQQTTDSSFTH